MYMYGLVTHKYRKRQASDRSYTLFFVVLPERRGDGAGAIRLGRVHSDVVAGRESGGTLLSVVRFVLFTSWLWLVDLVCT